MPGKRCTVAVCTNSHSKTKQDGVIYHSFPRDPEMRSKWVRLCGRKGKWNPDSCSICSEHFLPEDYERDLKAELLNLPSKKKLKISAVPSQELSIKSLIIKKKKPVPGDDIYWSRHLSKVRFSLTL